MSIESVISQLQAEKKKPKERNVNLMKETEIEPKRKLHPNQQMPKLIDLKARCPGACWDFTAITKPLPVVPAQSQENAIVADLLLVLTGVSGRYITPDRSKDSISFVLAEGLEICYAQMVNAVLPLAVAFSKVTRFVTEKRQFHYGRVNHALCAGLDQLCRDYCGVMARLSAEHRESRLNLPTLFSKIQPYIYIFQSLADVCDRVEHDIKGGKTLTVLNEAVQIASGKCELLLKHLLETAAVPYMQQLHIWLTQGVVDDPYSEFLIEDNQVVFEKEILPDEYSEDYWVKCYTLCKDQVPDFLSSYSQTILRTGKYLNVLRQCDVKNPRLQIPELRYSCNENLYTESIRQAHLVASKSLLKHLMVEVDLTGHLRSVRNYLLLAQGDLLTKFMDMAAPELDKEIMEIVPSRLQSLLELALRTSTANVDPYKDLLRVELHQETMMNLLVRITGGDDIKDEGDTKGWEALAFLYTPPWPASLVLNRSALTIYQLIFRHLFYCRHVESLLHRVWLEHKRRELWAAWDLRQRMLLYVNNLQYYMLVEVIEPEWNLLVQRLPNCRDLDEVLECHSNFQSECLIKCMLNHPKHFEILNTFLRKCVEFCRFMDACALVEASPVHSATPAISFTESQSFSAKIAEFNQIFNQHVKYLFRTLQDSDTARRSDKLTDMLYRLDFNSYYKNSVASRSRESVRSRDMERSRESLRSRDTERSRDSGRSVASLVESFKSNFNAAD